ncbi:MAG: hypothetical protein HY859_17665, partial [Caulobacterales bacterium]|nr:hypothetical protein [Caulobacterales bacterium]
MQPPYPPPWNPPPYGSPGYQPPPAYGQPGFGLPPATSFALTQLEQRTTTWVVIVGVSWFVGLMWAVGPFAWWQGTQIEREYLALGVQPTNNVKLLRILGMVTSILAIVGFVVLCAAIAIGIIAS